MAKESGQQAIEQILSDIIDQWYQNVSGFYRTADRRAENSESRGDEELKKFHDDKGHRIKFNKGDLDFTYGLRSRWEDEDVVIEVSVNNKVERFDYADFQVRLLAYYDKLDSQKISSSSDLGGHEFGEVFQFKPSLQEAFTVEQREGRADIMRLSFHLNSDFLEALLRGTDASRRLVEDYCVSPFRSVYATVYRKTSR